MRTVGNTLRKFIYVDVYVLEIMEITMARILVDIDLKYGLYESMELVAGECSFSQTLDYLNVPIVTPMEMIR